MFVHIIQLSKRECHAVNLSHKPLHIIYHAVVHMSSILHPFVKKYCKLIFKTTVRLHVILTCKKSLHSEIYVRAEASLKQHFGRIMQTFTQ